MYQVLVGSNHSLCRAGLVALMAELDAPGATTVEDFAGALARLDEDSSIRLALLDTDLPGMGGLDGLRRLKMRFARLHLVALSPAGERDQILSALSAGLHGLIPKTLSSGEMIAALRTVRLGQIYVPATLSAAPAPRLIRNRHVAARGAETLTDRQREVLDLVVLGRSNKEIGRLLGISEGTVKVHVTATFRQLGVHNRMSAASVLRGSDLKEERRAPYLPGLLGEERRA